MQDDPLRSAIDTLRSRLHEEIDAHLTQVSSAQQETVEAARRAAEAEAEQRWASRVEEVRSEWTARLESEVSAARGEAERRMVAESMRLRVEAEQAAAESNARVRDELEQALADERERADVQIAAERQHLAAERDRLQRELDEARGALDAVRRERQAAEEARLTLVSQLEQEQRGREEETQLREQTADARVAERQTQLAVVERLLSGIRSMDAGRSLSDVLTALTTAAAAEAPRVAVFVVNGGELRGWKASGFDVPATSLQASSDDQGLLGQVLHRREPIATADGAGPAAPAFASLPPGRASIAVPLLVGAQPVAVLYADDASEGNPSAPASWPEAIQILGRHASVNLAHLTAARAAEAMRRSLAPVAAAPGADAPAGAAAEDGNSARRYARLLVSEIKLYNEAAVRVGRQNRDLLSRLKPEIERARKLYAQRISAAVDSRGALFQQELIQTLADGDASLLGHPA